MPRYRVVSGEINGTNGHTPKSKTVRAKDPEKAAYEAHVIGKGGKITRIVYVAYDEDEGTYIFQALTTSNESFQVVVQELRWFQLF